MSVRASVAVSAVLALAACGGVLQDSKNASGTGDARVVVAVIDTAINPYHEFYYAGSSIYPDRAPSSVTPEVLEAFGIPPENVIELTRSGNIVKDKKADEEIWKNIRRGKPYWFKGTNMIGISFAGAPMLVPDPQKNPHGVGVTAAVLEANPDAVVVFTETWDDYANDEAATYVLTHPAVDIINSSYGYCVPVVCTLGFPVMQSVTASYDGVVKMGKLHFQSSGNEPGVTPIHGGQGQWWEIGIGGIEEGGSGGQTSLARNFPDFVGDFSQDLPYCMDCERGVQGIGGTSFSSPRSAGVTSRVLLEARAALGHRGGIVIRDGVGIVAEGAGKTITNWDLRRALEQAAWVPGTGDFDPTAVDAGVPVNDAAPWLQVAWGELSADPEKAVVSETLAHLGFGTPSRSKDTGFCDFQTANVRFRQNYWDQVAAANGTGETVPDPNPFVFCGSPIP